MKKIDNCKIIIFGASGDLTKRKLIPALFDLYCQGELPKEFSILGVSRTEYSDEEFRKHVDEGVKKYSERKENDPKLLEKFIKNIYYLAIDTAKADDYAKVKDKMSEISKESQKDNYIYYLSTPPKLYSFIAESLQKQGMTEQNDQTGWRRMIIEKPFGYDLDSAKKLNQELFNFLKESQIYRIDHYLGKETVQNIMVFRFANSIFEPLWNQKYIERIEITSSESIGVEDRGGYYDGSGALRDMIQNHMLQILGMITMEPPSVFEANAIRNETLKVFQSLRQMNKEDVDKMVIRGQYTESKVKGEKLKGYREEKDVAAESKTETFVALKLFIDNWRWGGTPIYIRSGKRLPTRVTEVVITFKNTPHNLFKNSAVNQLIMRIQPHEGLLLKFGMKNPGAGFDVKAESMDFHYDEIKEYVPTAYERLLLDCMMGDQTLYTRHDAVEACWTFVQPIIDAWKENPEIKVYGYPAGTWGPMEADNLIEGEDLTWHYPCKNLTNDDSYCEL
ncbi:MAG: glucose-6-phosphate dehydrogenase [Candidatus Sericytochromatia bacterium]|nr:glucose-6-phosphate dehydrogenase [Candidatus Sericytochromatia bacterium]